MGLQFFVGEVQGKINDAVRMDNEGKQAIAELQSSISQFLSAPLSGKAYESAKNYFQVAYTPLCRAAIMSGEALVSAHKRLLGEYQSTVGSIDTIEDEILDQINRLESLKKDLNRQMSEAKTMRPDLERRYINACDSIMKRRERLQKFTDYNTKSDSFFEEYKTCQQQYLRGLAQVQNSKAWNSTSGTFDLGLLDMSWAVEVNERWKDYQEKHMSDSEKLKKNLKEQYGFNEEITNSLVKVRQGLAKRFPKLSQNELDYLFNRLVGGLVYGNSLTDDLFSYATDKIKWGQTAGELTKYFNNDETLEDIFITLGLSTSEYKDLYVQIYLQHIICSSETTSINNSNLSIYSWLKKDIEKILGHNISNNEFMNLWNDNYSNMSNSGDYAHQAITTATILDNSMNLTSVIYGQNKTDKLAGWLGDATIKGENGLVSFGNDDYMADLDAANIAYLMKSNNWDCQKASANYYNKLAGGNTRADIFLKFNTVGNVQKEILTELNINSLDELKRLQPDAYNFIISLKYKSNTMVKG